MNYTRNGVYSYVRDVVHTANENAYISSRYEPTPPSFPAVFVREVGKEGVTGTVTFSGGQDVQRSSFEVQIVSNKKLGGAEEVESLLQTVTGAFTQLFYIRGNVNVLEDTNDGRYRLRASFRRIIGIADAMPTT